MTSSRHPRLWPFYAVFCIDLHLHTPIRARRRVNRPLQLDRLPACTVGTDRQDTATSVDRTTTCSPSVSALDALISVRAASESLQRELAGGEEYEGM